MHSTTTTTSPPAIEVRNLTKTYPGAVEAVKGLTFDVARGEVFGLLGPNGAGKSTTVGMLTTTIAPTSGRARLAGFDVATDPVAARRASAVVFPGAGRRPAPHRSPQPVRARPAVGTGPHRCGGAHRRDRRRVRSGPAHRLHRRPAGSPGHDHPRHHPLSRSASTATSPQPLIVAGNLVVAVALAGLQVAVVVGASALRGAEYDLSATGVGWFAVSTLGFAIAMHGLAEVLANRLPTQEEYIAALPPVAIVPYFFAGGLFPISALPAGLTVVAKALPITHVLALMRYGLVDRTGQGLHDIWGMTNTTAMASLSLAVVGVFAAALTAASIRVFKHAAVS